MVSYLHTGSESPVYFGSDADNLSNSIKKMILLHYKYYEKHEGSTGLLIRQWQPHAPGCRRIVATEMVLVDVKDILIL